MKKNGRIFCAVLMVPIICCGLMIIEFSDVAGLKEIVPGKFVAISIVISAPVLFQDISHFGNFTPAALAGSLTYFAPRRKETKTVNTAIAICVVGWILFVALSAMTRENAPFNNSMRQTLTPDAGIAGIETLENFMASARLFYLAIAASLLGMQIRSN